jgi:hypothetical protein
VSRALSPRRCFTDAEAAAAVLLLFVLLAVLLLAPFMMSAVVRIAMDMRLPFALMTSICLSWVALVPFVHYSGIGELLRRTRPFDWLQAIAGAGLIIGLTCWCLYNRYFGGLSNYRGTDGSFHANIVDTFAYQTPIVYGGSTVFHTLSFWYERLFGTHRFMGFVFGIYGGIALTGLISVTVAAQAASQAARASTRGLLLFAMLAVLVGLEFAALMPLLHLYQTDGFFPQVFALFPLFLMWAADALVENDVARFGALVMGMALYRYTYGLNLPDAALAFAFLAAARALGTEGWRRFTWGAVYFVGMMVATRAFNYIWQVRSAVGHFLPFEWQPACIGHIVALLILAGAYLVSPAGSRLRRISRFPFWFGLVNLPLALCVRFLPPEGYYYGAKYTFHGFLLVGTAAAIAAPAAIHQVWIRRRSWVVRPLLILPLLAALAAVPRYWYTGFEPYQKGFLERAFAKPPYTENAPLADLGALKRVPKILHEENKGFGGYMISSFGMMMFMNAALGHPQFGWGLWFSQALLDQAGRCIFWDEGSTTAWPVWEAWFAQKHIRSNLTASSRKKCVHYATHWDPQGPPRRLCYRCN